MSFFHHFSGCCFLPLALARGTLCLTTLFSAASAALFESLVWKLMVHCMEMLALSALPYLQLSASASFYSLLAITKPFLHDIFFVKGVLCSNHVTSQSCFNQVEQIELQISHSKTFSSHPVIFTAFSCILSIYQDPFVKADPKGVCAFLNDCDTGVKLSPSSCMLHFHFAGRWLRQSCPHNIEQLHPGLLNIFPRGCFVSSCCGRCCRYPCSPCGE